MIEKIIEAGMQGIDILKINGDEIHSKQNTLSEISKKETAEIADSKAKIADIPDTEMIANTSIETIFENIRKQFENSAIGKNAENVEFSDKKSDHTTVRQINPNNAFDNSGIYNITQIEKNKLDGCKREENVEKDLEKKYPPEEGYTIIREAYLRDKNGNIVRDPETGTARRIDFVVVKHGKAVDSIEVTGMNVNKSKQMEHEKRVKEEGGVYIRDNNGNLVKVDVNTRIERRP